MRIISLRFILAGFLVFFTFTTGESKDHPERPNIILIMADDLGFETIGCYGGTSYNTPRIDQMAEEGMLFEQCYAQPLCTPSRVKIMTGKYNFRNYERWGYLNQNETTFAHILKSAGYATCIAGKWQLRGDEYAPFKAGFDEYLLWQLTFTSYNERYKNPRVLENGKMKKYMNGEYGPQIFTDYITGFMERNKEDPFFVYYPMVLTHRPYVPSPDSDDYDEVVIPGSGNAHDAVSHVKYFKDEVEYMDKIVGQIIDKVHELGIGRNTLILFTGDNGTGSGIISKMGNTEVPGMKGSTNEYGTHVPLVTYWNGFIKPGQRNKNLIDFSDFLPTFCDVAGIELPESFITDGISFQPQLMNVEGETRDLVFCHFDPGKSDVEKCRFVHNGKWKLYENGEIYNIQDDPFEKKVIAEADLNSEQKILISTFRDVHAISSSGTAQQESVENIQFKSQPSEVGKTIASNIADRNFGWRYPNACTYYGALIFADAINDKGILQKIENGYAPFLKGKRKPHSGHVDYNVFGIWPFEMYRQTGNEKYLQTAKKLADDEFKNPRDDGLTELTRFWVDDMYMVGSLQVQAYKSTKYKVYLNRAALQLKVYCDSLQRANGLFHHRSDAPFYWGRGNGWAAAAMTELLLVLPESHDYYPPIMYAYQKMMATLIEFQGEDGMWHQLLDDPESYPESSCTGMFMFALASGLDQGWLSTDKYTGNINKGWDALSGYVNEKGEVMDVCIGTNAKDNKKHYLTRPKTTGNFHGQAAVLWAATAMVRLQER